MIESRSSNPLRSEIQLLSQLCWDDTPDIDINSFRFSRDWLNRTSTVLRNAFALCGMRHLQVFKAFDAKISEHTFPQLDNELGLRHVMAQEFFAAGKKIWIWSVISQLHSKGGGTLVRMPQRDDCCEVRHLLTVAAKTKDTQTVPATS